MYNATIRQPGTLGRDESLPGVPFIRLMNPTDFDDVREAMRITIKEKLDWDFVNPLAWKTIGLSGGPIDKFLVRYKEVATRWGVPYNSLDKNTWIQEFTNTWDYDPEVITLLFDTFGELVNSNKVPQSILSPWLYTPDDSTSFDKYLKMGLTYAVVGTVAYFTILHSPKIIKGFMKKK